MSYQEGNTIESNLPIAWCVSGGALWLEIHVKVAFLLLGGGCSNMVLLRIQQSNWDNFYKAHFTGQEAKDPSVK